MKDRLRTKIEQLRWYHRGFFGGDFDFRLQPSDITLAEPPTDQLSISYYLRYDIQTPPDAHLGSSWPDWRRRQ